MLAIIIRTMRWFGILLDTALRYICNTSTIRHTLSHVIGFRTDEGLQ